MMKKMKRSFVHIFSHEVKIYKKDSIKIYVIFNKEQYFYDWETPVKERISSPAKN